MDREAVVRLICTRGQFRKPPIGRRGYHPDDVDAFLDGLADWVAAGASAAEVRDATLHSRFGKPPMFSRGYDDQTVDEFLDRIIAAAQ